MTKPRNHNEWFNPVEMGGRKSCPTCKEKLGENESIWSWSEYVNAKKRLIKHFCRNCFAEEVAAPLVSHASDCGCNITLVVRGAPRPEWLVLRMCIPEQTLIDTVNG